MANEVATASGNYPTCLVDEKLEIEYIGLLINNPKGIAMFYFENKECYFSTPGLLNIYKLIVFKIGEMYAPEQIKSTFSFPKVNDETDKIIDICQKYATDRNGNIAEVYNKLKKLFMLKGAYDIAATEAIKQKIIGIRNYERYEDMTIAEIRSRVDNIGLLSSLNEGIINEKVTDFLLERNNNLKSGLSMPFTLMTKTFKGIRKGETMSFSMPSNAGKSRFLLNLICHLAFVEHKKILLISNEMTEDKMKLCLITTIINSPEIQKLHGQVLHKREAELLALKFRVDEDKKDQVELDKDGFILKRENETDEEFNKRLATVSEEFNKTIKATDWVSEQMKNAIYFVYTSDHTNQELRNIIMDYLYKEAIEYAFYDTLKTDIENIGNGEELKKTATVLSTMAQKYKIFVGSTLQLQENSTPPLSLNINDIATNRTVKEVLDNLCLIKEVNRSTYKDYEISDEEEGENYRDIEMPELLNTKYYACVVDKNRAGSKPRLLYRVNLDYNSWEEMGYVRFKQQN